MNNSEGKLSNLTNKSSPPYAKGGDIFMAEPGNGEKSPESTPKDQRAESAGARKQISSEEKSQPAQEGQGDNGGSSEPKPPGAPEPQTETSGAGKKPPKEPPKAPPVPPGDEQSRQPDEGKNQNEQVVEEPREESQREAIKRLVERYERGSTERQETIAELLKQFSPLGTYVPEILIDYSLEDNDLFESLVNRIVSLPLDKETSDYSLGLFAGSNLETMSDRVTQAIDRTDDLHERNRLRELKERLTLAQESSALIHNMNKLVVTGEMDAFIRTAEGITPEHLNYLQKLVGVDLAMRTYDEVYQKYLAKYGWIYPFVSKQLHREVLERLVDLNKKTAIGPKKLEEWELRRAYNIGRKFFNTSFRSAELVATGTVPVDLDKKEKKAMIKAIAEAASKGDDATVEDLRKELAEAEERGTQRFSSFPLESAARIMNPVQLTMYRFIMAENRGSQVFLENAKKHFQEYLERNGDKNGINKIVTLGGVDVSQMETGGVFGVSGIYSSWRNENFLFPTMQILINGKKTNIRNWLANNAYEIGTARNAEDSKALAKALEPLMDNMNVGLGILLKQGIFSGKVAYEARRQLWGKILLGRRYEGVDVDPKAEKIPEIGNLPLLINYLSKIEATDKSIESIEQIKKRIRPTNAQENYWDEAVEKNQPSRWELLLQKINVQHNINIKSNIGQALSAQSPEFTNEEKGLIEAIKLEGKKLPEHLADIAFPYTPFMNDVPFEIFDYEVAGAEFYKRRSANDIPSYFNAAKAFTAIVDSPGGIGAEEAIKQFRELERGIESPNGSEDAQRRTFPLFEAWLDWVMTHPGERQAMLKSLKQTFLKPTSDAQKWSGMEALTIDEQQTRQLIDQAVLAGVLNAQLADKLKDEKNVKFRGLLWMFFRDVFFTIIPLVATQSFTKELVSSKR